VFDHPHLDAAPAQIRAARNLLPQLDAGRDASLGAHVAAHKRHAGVRSRGPELDPHVPPAPISEAGDGGATGDRLLKAGGGHANEPSAAVGLGSRGKDAAAGGVASDAAGRAVDRLTAAACPSDG
jgi:hypothetical protein